MRQFVMVILFLFSLLSGGKSLTVPVLGAASNPLSHLTSASSAIQKPVSVTSRPAGRPAFRVFTDRDGLPENTVRKIVFDQRGYLWVGTLDGAACYNGRVWTLVNMPNRVRSNDISALLAARDGSLWFGTNGGGVSHLKDGQWQTFDETSGLPTNPVFSLAEEIAPDGHSILWLGTYGGGLARFEHNTWTQISSPEIPNDSIVLSILPVTLRDGSHSLWVATRDYGIAVFQNGQWRSYRTTNGFVSDHVEALALMPASTGEPVIWAGTVGGGLARFEGAMFSRVTLPTIVPSNNVQTLAATPLPDGKSCLWVGTDAGVVCLENGNWLRLDDTTGLPGNDIASLAETVSSSGRRTIWIGTNGHGLVRVENGRWARLDLPVENTDHMARCFLETRSATGAPVIWIGTLGSGVLQFANGQWKKLTVTDGLAGNRVRALFETRTADGQSTIWIGTDDGLSKFENGQMVKIDLSQSGIHREVRCLATTTEPDGSPTLWVGTYDSLGRFHNGVWTAYSKRNQTLKNNGVNCLLVTKADNGTQTVWAGTYGGGLSRFENGVWSTCDIASGLPNNIIISLHETKAPDGVRWLWVGTKSGGVARTRLDQSEFKWEVFSDSTQLALPNNCIQRICEDRQHRLYLFTNKGVARLSPRQATSDDPSLFSVFSFTSEDGLPSNECLEGAALIDQQGRMYAGTIQGTAVYDLETEEADTSARPLFIERIRLNGKWQETTTWLEKVSLAYDENNLMFEYALLNYFRESDTSYRTQLSGFETQPSDWTSDYKKEYTNLSEGQYEFRLWARDYAGNISGPVKVAFAVRPAPWRTWWAYLMYLAILSTAGYQVYAERIRRIKRRQEERIRYLRHLLDSTRIINSQLDLTTVLQNIAEESAQLIEGEPGGIGLVIGNHLVFKRLWCRDHWDETPVVFRLGEGVAGQVASTGKPMIVNDPPASSAIVFPEMLEKYYVHGFMNIPIFTRTGSVVGVLDVRRPALRGPFSETDQKLLESLANQAAVAIENAALYGELEKKKTELEEKNLIIVESMQELEKLYKSEQEISHTLQELNQMKTNFLIVTSHEMRTPLTVLKGYIEAISEEYLGPLSKGQHQSMATCRRMIDRLVTSFNDILEMLKINEGQMTLNHTALNLRGTVSEVLAELATFVDRRHQTIEVESPEDIAIVADPEKIQLVLVNVIQNAIKFTPDEGLIRITIAAEASMAHLTVEDTGIGIEPTDLERIFEKFYTTSDPSTHTSGRYEFSARGTGLGLAIAKSYVEAHGGKIWAESKGKGQGSSFHIKFPLATLPRDVEVTEDSVHST
ncbi:MAG TPA: ATP-binding protein [Acidobacteriota bacterium]|nr:ATP-binding protein [Acidobacteriota bacterium]HNG92092.1 ATP-binding protein [Acidobacteriota bacterium]